MSGIAVELVIDTPISFVWSELSNLTNRVGWMQAASDIRFPESGTAGTRTRFECDNTIGPFFGTGVFTVIQSGSATVVSRVEELTVPWYLAGPLGATAARPMLRTVWRRNLRQLKQQIESSWAQERRTNA